MTRKIKTIHYGIGSIGSRIARVALERDVEIVGAIDRDQGKVGRDLGEVIGIGKPLGVVVSDDPKTVLSTSEADIVLHSTTSLLREVRPQIIEAIEAGLNVISTCEELAYPYARHPEIAEEIDVLAKRHGVTVLGTGVNPGFIMDTLVIALTAVCQSVDRIQVTRVIDPSRRRLPLQRKVGLGLTLDEFERRREEGSVGHIGLLESMAMTASALGWELDAMEETVDPVIVQTRLRGGSIELGEGKLAGIRQVGRGFKDGREIITLDLQMYVGAEDYYDHIVIEGTPKIDLTIRDGLPGDMATAAIVVNSIPRVIDAEPGLMTMKDLPLICVANF